VSFPELLDKVGGAATHFAGFVILGTRNPGASLVPRFTTRLYAVTRYAG
jgi:hypothetical protein